MVSQLQLAFLLAHNELVERARAAGVADDFGAARKTLTRLYHWVLWHDFVRRIAIDEVYECALRLDDVCGGRKVWTLGLSDVYMWKHQPFMPVEFSGAAYRFGHRWCAIPIKPTIHIVGLAILLRFLTMTARQIRTICAGSARCCRKTLFSGIGSLRWILGTGAVPAMARKIDTKLANALAICRSPAGRRKTFWRS